MSVASHWLHWMKFVFLTGLKILFMMWPQFHSLHPLPLVSFYTNPRILNGNQFSEYVLFFFSCNPYSTPSHLNLFLLRTSVLHRQTKLTVTFIFLLAYCLLSLSRYTFTLSFSTNNNNFLLGFYNILFRFLWFPWLHFLSLPHWMYLLYVISKWWWVRD